MHKKIAAVTVVAIVFLAMADFSQAQREAGDTASHRRIPLTNGAKAPSMKDFNIPELRE